MIKVMMTITVANVFYCCLFDLGGSSSREQHPQSLFCLLVVEKRKGRQGQPPCPLPTNKKQQSVLTERKLKKMACNALYSGRNTVLEYSFSCDQVYR